jgi:Flp pilus assembly secretin CpaC
MAFVACGGLRPRWLPVLSLLFAIAAIAAPRTVIAETASGVPAADAAGERAMTAGEPINVQLDQAKLLRLPAKTATLVIGNPLIADVAVQPGGIMVVTAKGYGTTNLVALDRAGATLMEHPIQVTGPVETVVLYRGIERETYSCLPNCERRITLGDTVNYFNANLAQGATFNLQAQGGQLRQ